MYVNDLFKAKKIGLTRKYYIEIQTINHMSDKSSPSPATYTVFISILTLILLLIRVFNDGSFSLENGDLVQITYIVGIAIFLAMVANWRRVNSKVNKIKSRIKFLFHIVIEYRRGHLEFLDKYGKKAMYNEESLFKRIRWNTNYESSIVVDGKIDDEIHTYNCYNTINHRKNKITIVYGKKKKNKDIVHNKRQLQFAFIITLLDSFPKEKEFWGTRFAHYTKTYDLKLSFHKNNPPKNVALFSVTGSESEKNLKLTPLPIDPLIMQKYGRIVLKIKLLHVNKGDEFRVYWDWKKKNINK